MALTDQENFHNLVTLAGISLNDQQLKYFLNDVRDLVEKEILIYYVQRPVLEYTDLIATFTGGAKLTIHPQLNYKLDMLEKLTTALNQAHELLKGVCPNAELTKQIEGLLNEK